MDIKKFEAYSRFKKEPFISSPLKVGDQIIFQYSNGAGRVKVKEINGQEVELMRSGGWYQDGIRWLEYNTIKFPLYRCQQMKDAEELEKHNKTQDINKDIYSISRALKLSRIKGGSLNNIKVINELAKALITLSEIGDQYNTQDSSIPAAGGWSGTMSASRSGKAIDIYFNDVHSGGYYNGSTPFIVQIRVGGGLSYEKQKVLLEISKQLLSKYTYSTDLGDSRITDTDGTNWSSIMLTAPKSNGRYSINPTLVKYYEKYMDDKRNFKNDVEKYNL